MSAKQSSFTREQPGERRQSLIEACAHCLAKLGTGQTSVRAICKEAGVSPGLLRHYFAGVDALIAATYRWTGQRVSQALEQAVEHAGNDPRARLLAYLTASFRPPIASTELLATWLAFWSLTKTDPVIARQHAEIYADYRGGIERLIAEYRPDQAEVRLSAVALTALVDGLWLELSLGSAPFTTDEAVALAEKWLDHLLD
jgi:TetR/AcrR family transcriptional repressor of bet genes